MLRISTNLKVREKESTCCDPACSDLMAVHGSEEMLRFEFTQYQRTEVEKKAMAPTDRSQKHSFLWTGLMEIADLSMLVGRARYHGLLVVAWTTYDSIEALRLRLGR
ncbi:unnamed protein product, partial [Mesorhabditis belari]|uniref:Uncharacterized protein n=1 Tax=Mesorhabditis belari TaxID=2138241 RepID=A0AAF3EF76_9BILA